MRMLNVEFAGPDAPQRDLVITGCDDAAGAQCPCWPGHPATAHWGYADPSAVQGTDDDRLEAFRRTLAAIRQRLGLLLALPADGAGKLALQAHARKLSGEQPS